MKPPLFALCVCCRWNHRHVSYLNCVCFTDENRRQALHHQRSPRQLSALCVFYRWNHRHVSYLHCVCFTGGTIATSAICTVCVLQVEPSPRQLSALCVFYRWNQTASVTPSTTATSATSTGTFTSASPP